MSQFRQLALEAAAVLLDEFSVGTHSHFCDEPDFDSATQEEIADKLLPFLVRAADRSAAGGAITVRSESEEDIKVGLAICDMHDSLELGRLSGRFTAGAEVSLSTDIGDEIIQRLVSNVTGKPYSYCNKYLVVVSINERTGYLTAAYSYDARFVVFISLRPTSLDAVL